MVFRWAIRISHEKEKRWAYMRARAPIDDNVKSAYPVLGFWVLYFVVEEIPFALWMNECAMMIDDDDDCRHY